RGGCRQQGPVPADRQGVRRTAREAGQLLPGARIPAVDLACRGGKVGTVGAELHVRKRGVNRRPVEELPPPGGGVPDTDSAASPGEELTAGVEGKAPDRNADPQGDPLPAALQVPEPDSPVTAAGGQPATSRREDDTGNRVPGSFQYPHG